MTQDSLYSAMIRKVRSGIRKLRGSDVARLPEAAREEQRRDEGGLPGGDPGPDRVVEEALGWLLRAQAESRTNDGGVARDYSLIGGWASSYPETTGYIIPTLLDDALSGYRAEHRVAARRMLDWLLRVQFPEGGFPGGKIDEEPQVPVVFNTGQILFGLASGAKLDPDSYYDATCRAAEWLVNVQDSDGAWRRHNSPFAAQGEKTYDTHVAWGLLEAARQTGTERFAAAARANIEWAMAQARPNGWPAKCCLNDPNAPLTHTLGYFLRGVLEGYRYFGEEAMLREAVLVADALGRSLGPDGFLSGRFASDWSPQSDWACLTGMSQVAICWIMLYQETGEARYLEFAQRANSYVRRTIHVEGAPELRGGVKGSFPVSGPYCGYQFINWAAKFTIDANRYEIETG